MKKKLLSVLLVMLLLATCIPLGAVSVSAATYEYAMFPMTYLNISQGVNGSYSHQGTKAIDITGKDGGIDPAYAPFTGVVKKIYDGNTVWLESSNPVVYANGTVDYMTIMVVHDNNTSDLYVGKKINQGEHFFDEGTAGNATGNHIHLECGRGKFTGSGWYKNGYGIWMINNPVEPYNALHISNSTIIKNGYGYSWKTTNHTHNYSTYVYYWKAHPHYKCYQCSCGEVKENRSEPVNLKDCDECNPLCKHTYDNACDTTCNDCGFTRTVSGHNYAPATCTSPKICTHCGATEGERLGHTIVETMISEPTCTEEGVKNRACSVCGAGYDEKIKPLGHEWKEATCTEPKTCKVCGVTSGSALGHKSSYLYDCEEPAICEVCGVIVVPAMGHSSFRDVIKEATCGTAGLASYDCIECGKHHRTEEIPATGRHIYANVCDTECDVCGNIRDVSDHVWKSGTCSVCGEVSQLPIIVAQPQTAYAKKGEYAKITVEATGEGLAYAWYLRDVEDEEWTLSSQNSNVYKQKMDKTGHNREVYCVITDKYANKVKTDTVYARMAASITKQPATAAYAKKGAKVSVKITASGDGLKYTWYIKNDGGSKYSKSSVTSSTYSTTMSSKVKGRRVYCVVKDKYGKSVQSKTFILRESVSITAQPKTVTVAKNKTAKVTVKASGDGLKYTWYIKNAGSSKYSKSSVKTASYSVKMTSKVKNRLVYCVVTDKYGKTVKTVTVKLKMK